MTSVQARSQTSMSSAWGRRVRLPRAVEISVLAILLAVAAALLVRLALYVRTTRTVPHRVYPLDAAHQTEWKAIGGNWQFHDDLIESRHSDDRGAKLLTGSEDWRNYTLTSDIRFNSDRGDLGVILRSQDEQNGVDAYNGYYVGLRSDGGTLIIGRSNYGWVEALPVPLPGGFQAMSWYRLRVTAYGCDIAAMVENLATEQTAWIAFHERSCVREGRFGLRAVDVDGAWRNIRIAPATQGDYLAMRQHTDSVEQPVVLTGPPWWTPWHISELFLGTLVAALFMQLSYYRFQQWKTGTILQERQRLAHDIHDTMAQNFAGLGYHIQGIRSGLLRGGLKEPQQVAEQLSLAYQLIRRCHKEASETIQMLGTSSLAAQEELSKTLVEAAYRIVGNSIVVEHQTTGTPPTLNLRLVDALHHIGREAITNAVTHSGLTRLTILVQYDPNGVDLRIRDNGSGFLYGPHSQGFGIAGMQKRTRDVRATLHITSVPGSGTEIRVCAELHSSPWHRALLSKLRAFLKASRQPGL